MPTPTNTNVLTIRRRGEFVVSHTGENKNQCGPLGTQVLRYFVSIVSKSTRLNAKGFIIDNGDVQKYFEGAFSHRAEFVSCENIARIACRDLLKKFGPGTDNASKVYGICVVVSGLPGQAELECMWVHPDYQDSARILGALRPAMAI